MGDSARYITISKVKSELKHILKKQQLFESAYLRFEKYDAMKRKVKEIRKTYDLCEIQKELKKQVERHISVLKSAGIDIDSCDFSGDVFVLYAATNELLKICSNYEAYLLSKEDISNFSGGHWIWSNYSENRIKERISKYFYWHQLSYIQMIKDNFPNLYSYLPTYLDTPYQTIIYLNLNQDKDDITSDPSMQYYYIASKNGDIQEPKIIITKKRLITALVFKEIQNSYEEINKKVRNAIMSSTGFSSTITSHSTGYNIPLSEYVYDTIKKDLEKIFGKF